MADPPLDQARAVVLEALRAREGHNGRSPLAVLPEDWIERARAVVGPTQLVPAPELVAWALAYGLQRLHAGDWHEAGPWLAAVGNGWARREKIVPSSAGLDP